jgi:chorismate synthase
MEYFVQHEGQKIPVPADIAVDETKLRRALSTIIPGIAEAQITKVEKDEVTTFSIVKVAGTKGAVSSPLGHLIGCTGGINPVLA